MLSHILNTQGVQIVQLGGKDDPAIKGCIHLQGKTSFHQSCYILKNSLLHLGNDSWTAHRAGEINIPLVALYASTSAANHGPYRYNEAKTSLIESHRWGRQPTFAAQELQPTIAVIPPELVANEVLRILGIAHAFTHQTRFQGLLSKQLSIDLVPNNVPDPTFLPELPFNVRMDWHHDESILNQILATGRRVNLFTTKVIDTGLLSHYRAQILCYNHELSTDDALLPSLAYVDTVRATIPKHTFFAREADEKRLVELRFRYFDHASVEMVRDPTKEDYIGAALIYLNREDTPQNRVDLTSEVAHSGGTLRFRTSRFVLSNGLIFLSFSHMKANQGVANLGENTGKVIDEPEFWRDGNCYSVFFQPNL